MKIADLCCGLGGWVIPGHRFIGFDIERMPYPGEFVLADVRALDGRRFRDFDLILASPPCQQFSQMLRIGKDRTPPNPDLSIVEACFRIRRESGVPTIIENVRDARRYFPEPAQCHRGPYWLWGDVPLLPILRLKPKIGGSFHKGRPSWSVRRWNDKSNSQERARIPRELARAVIGAFA